MKVRGINWLVTCTPRFNEMAAFCQDVLGLAVKSEGCPVIDTRFTRYAQFELPDASVVEILDGSMAMQPRG
jgi:hypothetical protein